MSRYTDLVRGIVRENKVSMEELLMLEDKVWSALQQTDERTYSEMIAALEDLFYSIDKTEAQNIVKAMRPYGEYWNLDTIREYLKGKGESDHLVDYYMAMNMARNDYYDTARAYGAGDDVEFYYNIACNFIHDEDAKPHKLAKYFRM